MTNIQTILLAYLLFSVIATPIILWELYKDTKATFKKRSEVLYLVLLSFEKTVLIFKYRVFITIIFCAILTSPITMLFIIYSVIKERWNGRSELDMYFDRQDAIEKEQQKTNDIPQSPVELATPFEEPTSWGDQFTIKQEADYSTVIDEGLTDFANFFSMHYRGMKFGDFYEGKEGYKFKYVEYIPTSSINRSGGIVHTINLSLGESIAYLSKKGIRDLQPHKDYIYFMVVWAAVKLETKRQNVFFNNNLIADATTIRHCRNIGLDMNKIQMDFGRHLGNNPTESNKERIIQLNKYVALNNKKKEVRAERKKNNF